MAMPFYLYQCDDGGGMVLGFEGEAPAWATCPRCSRAAECARCDGMQLVPGEAPAPGELPGIGTYRCLNGHTLLVRFIEHARPESMACRQCGGVMLAGSAA
jgi:hypothetical protein